MAGFDAIGRTLTVSEANAIISSTVSDFFSDLTIEGEISGFRPSSTGHWYFTLKDSGAAIDAAVFRGAQYSMEIPRNGDLVIAKGSLSYYTKNGRLSFVIRAMKVKGEGNLLEIIEKRKEYYRGLGYFDEDKKKAIPETIRRIGVVTSPTGAAIRDILNITRRRAPGIDIIIFPASVQGENAKDEIAMRIRQANLFSASDVLIVGRGGGSTEDLAAFSEPVVIEAIWESEIPVISAVGHEIDWPISDFVADKRAPTPSAAAELVTETAYRRRERIAAAKRLLASEMKVKIAKSSSRLKSAESFRSALDKKLSLYKSKVPSLDNLKHSLTLRLERRQNELAWTEEEILRIFTERKDRPKALIASYLEKSKAAIVLKVQKSKTELRAVASESEALSPLAILSRGYSMTMDESGKVIHNTSEIKVGERIRTRLAGGVLLSCVEEKDEL